MKYKTLKNKIGSELYSDCEMEMAKIQERQRQAERQRLIWRNLSLGEKIFAIILTPFAYIAGWCEGFVNGLKNGVKKAKQLSEEEQD